LRFGFIFKQAFSYTSLQNHSKFAMIIRHQEDITKAVMAELNQISSAFVEYPFKGHHH